MAEIFAIFCVQLLYAHFHLDSSTRYLRDRKCHIHLMLFHSKFQFRSEISLFSKQVSIAGSVLDFKSLW